MVHYKWVALSNTTIGVLMAAINGTIILISLPAILGKGGIDLNPFLPGAFLYLIWIIMGYNIITAVTLLTIVRTAPPLASVSSFVRTTESNLISFMNTSAWL